MGCVPSKSAIRDSIENGQIFLKKAQTCFEQGDWQMAEAHYKKSIEYYQEAKSSKDSASQAKVQNGLKSAYQGLGKLYEQQHKQNDAMATYRDARKAGIAEADQWLRAFPTQHAKSEEQELVVYPNMVQPTLVVVSPSRAAAEHNTEHKETQERIFTQNPKPFSRPIINTIRDIQDTQSLGQLLAFLKPGEHHFKTAHALALEVIEAFGSRQVKTPAMIEEMVTLAPCQQERIIRELLSKLIQPISDGVLLEPDLLEGIAHVLRYANPALLVPNDLVVILKAIQTRLQDFHQQDHHNNDQPLVTLLRATAHCLSAMIDASVQGVDRETVHKTLYDQLSNIADNTSDDQVRHYAKYARQALVWIPDNESILSCVKRHLGHAIEGILSLKDAITDLDPSNLIDAFSSIKEALTHQEFKQSWFPDLRYAELLVDCNQWMGFEDFVMQSKYHQTVEMVIGIIRLLEHALKQHPDLNIRCSIVQFLGNMFANSAFWGNHEKAQEFILIVLKNALERPDPETVSTVQKVLNQLSEEDRHRVVFDRIIPLDFRKRNLKHSLDRPSRYLLQIARREYWDLDLLRESVLMDPVVRKELSCYVPLQGRLRPNDIESDGDLQKCFMEFLSSNQKVFLLLGDAGSGKSLCGQQLERTLWEAYPKAQNPAWIPLWVNLSDIEKPEKDLLQKACMLKKIPEDRIKQLVEEQHRFLLILDGYDEIKSKENLYVTNHLDQNVKIVISCRTEYIMGSIEDYRIQFMPNIQGRFSEEVCIRYLPPFGDIEVDTYLKQYIQTQGSKWTLQQYKQGIQDFPELDSLLRSPFILKIAAKVLPTICEQYEKHSKETSELTRLALLDAFTTEWFEKHIETMMQKAELEVLGGAPRAEKVLRDYAEKLAFELYQSGLERVTYEFGDESSPWAKFFSEDKQNIALRRGCPLKKVGPNTYAFLDKSLLKYFLTPALKRGIVLSPVAGPKNAIEAAVLATQSTVGLNPVISPQMDAYSLNCRLLNDDPLMIQLMVDAVHQESQLASALWQILKNSKHDPNLAVAAANAATILNAANISFSGADLTGVRIAGANLQHAVLDSAILEDADLSNVQLQGAWLQAVNFRRANLTNIQFGEWPFMKLPEAINHCVCDDQGQYLAIACGQKVFVYDLNTRQRLVIADGHTDKVSSVAFHPNQPLLASSSFDKTVKLWNLQSGHCVTTLKPGKEARINFVAFNHTGQKLACALDDNTVGIWEKNQQGYSYRVIGAHENAVRCVHFSKTGLLASSSDDATIILWDNQDREIKTLYGHEMGGVLQVCFSPNPAVPCLASCSEDGTVRIWDYIHDTPHQICHGHKDWVCAIAWHPEGKQLVSGSADQTIRRWDAKDGRCLETLEGHNTGVRSIFYSPGTRQWVSGGLDGELRFWDATTNTVKTVQRNDGHYHRTLSIALHVETGQIASGSQDASIKLWSVNTGRCLKTLLGHTSAVYSVAFHENGQRLAAGAEDGHIRLWDVSHAVCTTDLQGHTAVVNDVVFRINTNHLISCSDDKNIKIWDFEKAQCIQTLSGHQWYIYNLTLSLDANYLASSSGDKTIKLWDLKSQKTIKEIQSNTEIKSVAFMQDAIIFAGEDRQLYQWDLKTDQNRVLQAVHSNILHIAVDSNTNQVIVGENKAVSVLSVSDKPLLFSTRMQSAANRVACATQKTGVRVLATAHDDGSVRCWSIHPQRLQLLWSSAQASLMVQDACFEGAQHLSSSNQSLLKLLGARMDRVSETTEERKTDSYGMNLQR